MGLAFAWAACGTGTKPESAATPQTAAGATPTAAAGSSSTSTTTPHGTAGATAPLVTQPTAGAAVAVASAGAGNSVAALAGAGASAPAANGGDTAPPVQAGSGGLALPMSGGAGAAGTPAEGSDAPLPSAGCTSGSLRAGRITGSIDSSGGRRTYIQYLPKSYDGTKPVPLVVDLHPFSVDASFAESSSGFRQLADTEGYMYLAPNGMGNMWDSVGDTDEKFIRDLVNSAASQGCIDLRRVYATGCSNGGAFSFLLMCTAEDIFAAVAPMCGTAFFDLDSQCMLDRPVSLMLRIGKQDTLNCWEGEGMDLNAPNVPAGTKVECAKTVQKILGAKNHCKGEIRTEAECEYLGDCDEGTEIAICDENTGHVVYTANTAQDTWAFLKRFYKH